MGEGARAGSRGIIGIEGGSVGSARKQGEGLGCGGGGAGSG